ncbi:cupin domain-containing protein [Paraburkholderia caribensis]|uniref:cupin domain-containing protein n=1 Tax=Paraburkholderia caribensis TaxID=75105 RepID=UPI0007A09B3E
METPDWGGAWMVIAPQSSSTPHDHDEEETFFVLSGNGEMTVDDETRVVGPGDMIYLPRFSRHTLKNIATNEDLKILCIWWGAPKD